MALASPRTSAQIIPLPGAAVAPVANTRGPGRWPACVVPARQLAVLRARTAAQHAAQALQARQSAVSQPADAQVPADYDKLPGTLFMLQVAVMRLEELCHV